MLVVLLAGACGGRQAPPAAEPPAPAATPAEDCAAICREAASAAAAPSLPPKSPCGPGRGRLEGKVLAGAGEPARGAFVAAQSSCGMFYSTTIWDGTFVVEELPAGPYLVAARLGDARTEADASVAAGATATLELRLGAARAGMSEAAQRCGCTP
jgi:hypothetical protein